MTDPKAIQAGEAARTLVTLVHNEERDGLTALITNLLAGDREVLSYVLLDLAAIAGELATVMEGVTDKSSDLILQELFAFHFRFDQDPEPPSIEPD